jgi:cob(I)alamin adenosyltransferase
MTGQFQIYTGDGKGKTTAALGLALRAAGAGLRVYFGQFIKTAATSEAAALRERFADRITHAVYGPARFVRAAPTADEIAEGRRGLDALREALAGGAYDVVIGDEALGAAAAGLFPEKELLALAEARPRTVELVLTGRGAGAALIAAADLVTEMRAVKHYYEKGVHARRGIEF